MNIKSLLNRLRYIGYIIIIIVDCGITFLSMMSLGHNTIAGIGLGALGVVIVYLMTWVFLLGIRVKGIKSLIYLSAWILCCLLIISLNWAFTRQNITSQSFSISTGREDAAFDRQTRQREIESTMKQIDALVNKLDKVNVWREADRKAIDDDIKGARGRLAELRKPVERSTDEGVGALSVFDKMAAPFGLKGQDASDWWWLIAFVALQLLAVLAAPKADEDASARRKRTPRASKPEDLTEVVWWWVWGHWTCIRAGRNPPHRLLPFHDFDVFIRARFREIPERVYQRIGAAAQRAGVIEGEEIRELNEEAARKKIGEAMR